MNLTNHIKTRYAERIAGRDTTIDINTYIAQNEEKIENDINKMIDHSEIIYSGMTGINKDNVNVRLSGSWIIITDQFDKIAITLYKVDFGIDEDFNKQYVTRRLEMLRDDMAKLDEAKKTSAEEINAYKTAMKSNEGLVSEYEALIRALKADNKAYQEIIDNKRAEWAHLEMEVRRDIEAFTKRREF